MNRYIRINAFTLAEFSVALTILTLISGLMLSSLFFINKWSYNYQSISNKYEDLFECATVFKTDFYLSDRIGIGSNKVAFVNIHNDTIKYHSAGHFLVRQVNMMHFDTTNITNNIVFNLNNNIKIPDSFTFTFIVNTDTLNVYCEIPNKAVLFYN
jgi:hypothetical protein